VHNVPGEFQLVTLVLGFPPGAWTPWHFHGGEGLVTILEGEFTLEILGQEPQTYGPGDHWKEHLGMPHRAGNETDQPARLAVTFILPVGTPTTIALPELALE
jgi:quercetin dioxygenase-like cupin family protein